jgi:hypothetical protein
MCVALRGPAAWYLRTWGRQDWLVVSSRVAASKCLLYISIAKWEIRQSRVKIAVKQLRGVTLGDRDGRHAVETLCAASLAIGDGRS